MEGVVELGAAGRGRGEGKVRAARMSLRRGRPRVRSLARVAAGRGRREDEEEATMKGGLRRGWWGHEYLVRWLRGYVKIRDGWDEEMCFEYVDGW